MAREAVASLAVQTSLDKWIPLRPAKANFLLHTRHTSICTEVSFECQGVACGVRGARETIPKFLRLPVWVPKIKPLSVLSFCQNCSSDCKESACNTGDLGSIPGSGEDPLEKETATHSSILSRDWSCTDHVNDHALFTWLIMYWSRDWSCTDHVADHALIT